MEYQHTSDNKRKVLLISIVLNFFITVFQALGGFIAGSLSLITDALHNLTDTFSLVTSFIALKLAGKKHTQSRTFGYKRAQILAALLNASLLIIVSFFLFKEAVIRLVSPVAIKSSFVIIVASAGLIANSLCVFLLKNHSRDNINMRSAFFHLFSDALVSLAVIIGAVFMYLFHIFWIDSVLALVIGIYVIKEGYAIVADAVRILMQYSPKGIALEDIQRDIEKIGGIKNIHHVHAWSLTEKDIHFEAHIDLSDDIKISESCILKDKIETLLKEKYSINHCTLQFEYELCKNTGLIR